MNIYEIGENYFGLSIKMEDRAFSTKLPNTSKNFNTAISEFMNELKTFLKGANNDQTPLVTVEFKVAVDAIINNIRDKCGKLDKSIKYDSVGDNLGYDLDALKEHTAKFKLPEVEDCPFSNSTLIIEMLSTGYF